MNASPVAKLSPDQVRTKRAYEAPAPQDGTRILIDRLWPRGIKKEALAVDQWCKELAPSTALRQWFGHEPARWEEFERRYAAELQSHAAQMDALRTLARKGTLTLVYGAHDELHNDAVVLRALLLAPPADRPAPEPSAD